MGPACRRPSVFIFARGIARPQRRSAQTGGAEVQERGSVTRDAQGRRPLKAQEYRISEGMAVPLPGVSLLTTAWSTGAPG